ncbi:DegQ family serine endoprotease [Mangrovicella endophytica]|uniref:DegQ family serine endoprotease n=1 Tax=Mangrovicella endophytica TaxID=2066697 RepID=UPI000C9E4169|nr:DegQ family serine endoprotease [Mangrovicella endophytica]
MAQRTVPTPVVPVPDASKVPSSQAEIKLSFAPLVKQTAPSVVNVYAARQVRPQRSPFADDPFFGQFFGERFERRPRVESSLGSGVIVDPKGLIVTNNHVIEGADEVKIALADGREFESDVLLKDAKVDLAVLKVRGDNTFPVLALADSDALEIGDLVLAIGNPFGIGQTVTNGIVSALARTHIGVNDFGFFIQTDAAINPGNSGGALIDMKGQLVGINTAIFSRSGGSNGIGFAIPSNMVRAFVSAAQSGGRFERPFIGASFMPVTPDIAEALGLQRPTGALIQSVIEDGPAAKAGLKAGDVILSMDGFPIDNPDALGYRLATAGIGKAVDLDVLSGGASRRSLSLTLTSAPEVPARDQRTLSGRTPLAGATVENLSPKVAGELELPQDLTGVVVADVERGSYAARFGLKPKDIILAVNGDEISDTASLEAALSEGARGWRFDIERDGQRLTQVVR